jgi:hypothetical protein
MSALKMLFPSGLVDRRIGAPLVWKKRCRLCSVCSQNARMARSSRRQKVISVLRFSSKTS